MLKTDRLLGTVDERRVPFKRRVKRGLCRCCVGVKSLSINDSVYPDIPKCEVVFRPLSSCRLTRLSVSSSSRADASMLFNSLDLALLPFFD